MMRPIFKKLASFLAGFALFAAGGAVAMDAVQTPLPAVVESEVAAESDLASPEQPQTFVDTLAWCSDIGKTNELGNDCYCVEGEVSDMAEVDCLIESGIVSSEERESYELWLSGNLPNITRSNENPVFCWAIGKEDELDGDCFCVEGDVTDMAEVDCLIASGIVDASQRESYRLEFESRD